MDNKRSTANVLVAMVLLVVLLAATYIGGYFQLSRKESVDVIHGQGLVLWIRGFEYSWMALVYQPMSALESLVTGEDILLAVTDNGQLVSSPQVKVVP